MRGVHVQITLLDAAYQGAFQDLLSEALLDLCRAERLIVGVEILVGLDPHQLHQDGQPDECLLALGSRQRLDHHAAETMVE